MPEPAIEFAVKEIDEEIQRIRGHVDSGGCETFEDYRHACGTITGLIWARAAVSRSEEEELKEFSE